MPKQKLGLDAAKNVVVLSPGGDESVVTLKAFKVLYEKRGYKIVDREIARTFKSSPGAAIAADKQKHLKGAKKGGRAGVNDTDDDAEKDEENDDSAEAIAARLKLKDRAPGEENDDDENEDPPPPVK